MGNNYKTIVYLTTNIKNNKIYVGVHNTENPDKFDGYIGNGINIYYPSSNMHPTCPFHYAVKKYGFNSFIRSTIKIFDNREDALKLEREIVNEDFILRNDTYNIVLGGGDPPKNDRVVYKYDLQGNYICEYANSLIASKSVGIKSGVNFAAINHTVSGGFLWSYIKEDKLDISKYSINIQNKIIYIYDKFGNFVKQFNKISDFCKEYKVTLGPVQRAILLKTKVRGYYISTEKIDKFIKEKTIKSESKVYQYDLNGNFIKEWNSCLEAYKNLGFGYSQISSKIKRGNPVCGKYQWSRVKVDKMPNRNIYINKKKVGQYTPSGKLIKIYDSVRECRKDFGNVSRVLSGKATNCKGYNFKYIVKDIV